MSHDQIAVGHESAGAAIPQIFTGFRDVPAEEPDEWRSAAPREVSANTRGYVASAGFFAGFLDTSKKEVEGRFPATEPDEGRSAAPRDVSANTRRYDASTQFFAGFLDTLKEEVEGRSPTTHEVRVNIAAYNINARSWISSGARRRPVCSNNRRL